MAKRRSFLKWAGSKFYCLSRILPSLGSGKRLIEPFVGSGTVFLNTDYAAYLLAEENNDLVQIFKLLQHQGNAFIDLCQTYFTPENNTKDRYYELRQQFNSIQDSPDKAAIFLYLNRHGYNGLCRYNAMGKFNVPFGLHPKPYFPSTEMQFFYDKCQKAHFLHQDFRDTFALAEPGDVIYCDPPYVPLLARSQPVKYTQKNFEEQDQIELTELAKETASKGIPVIISNHDTAFTRQLYQRAKLKSFHVARVINCQSDMRHPVGELLAVFKN